MKPKGFLTYLDRGIACALNNSRHSNTPPIAWTKIIQSMMFTKYPLEGITFLLSFVKAMHYLSKTL
jgi:hypothetical protein